MRQKESDHKNVFFKCYVLRFYILHITRISTLIGIYTSFLATMNYELQQLKKINKLKRII